jgi:hypothetical protein
MPYKQIDPEDQRKLHAELNQIINQRFLLTTTAITVFGAFSAFMIPKTPISSPAEVGHILVGGTVYLLIFYLLLFSWNRMLLSLQEVISVYLELRGPSQWEADFRRFVGLRPVGLRIQGWVFLVLGILSVSWPFAIATSLGVSFETPWLILLATFATLYFLVTYFIGFRNRNQGRTRTTWESVLKPEVSADVTPKEPKPEA